jgi:zinc transport system ATP-binding protein
MTEKNIKRTPVIEITNLSTGYGNETILEDIQLSLQPSDFMGLIGPNGGGKTTLLKTILGLIQPHQGEVRIMGQSPQKGRKHIGYVPQFTEFDNDFPINVRDIVRMGRLSSARLLRPFNDEDDAIVDQILTWMDIIDYKDRALRQLSGGQRQRVYIARALASKPDLLLLDEPTISVDFDSRTHIYELLHSINQQGVTILLVSHDLNVISTYVKSIGCLNRRLHYHGEKQITPEMIKATYNCPVELIAHGIPHRVLAEHEG